MSVAPPMPSDVRLNLISIGHYILGKTIGEGTFGKVKIGTHILTGAKVAVKILEKERILDVGDVERVAREIHILKLIRHPHIIQLYEIIETPKQLYLIMEFASGGELFDYIVEKKRLNENEAVKFFHQIINGVEKIHAMKVVHRDLKPENLLLDEQCHIKIVDFGLSNMYTNGQLLKTACGSPCYASPEMIAGYRYVPIMCDIWSCGVILYAMVCGYLPFEDSNTAALYKKILSANYKAPSFLSQPVADLISKMLVTDPSKRISTTQIKQQNWYQGLMKRTMTLETRNIEHHFIISRGCEVPDCSYCAFWNEEEDGLPIEKEILDQLLKYGFPEKYAIKCLELNKHNHATTTYYLLAKLRFHGILSNTTINIRKKNAYKKLEIIDKIFNEDNAYENECNIAPNGDFIVPTINPDIKPKRSEVDGIEIDADYNPICQPQPYSLPGQKNQIPTGKFGPNTTYKEIPQNERMSPRKVAYGSNQQMQQAQYQASGPGQQQQIASTGSRNRIPATVTSRVSGNNNQPVPGANATRGMKIVKGPVGGSTTVRGGSYNHRPASSGGGTFTVGQRTSATPRGTTMPPGQQQQQHANGVSVSSPVRPSSQASHFANNTTQGKSNPATRNRRIHASETTSAWTHRLGVGPNTTGPSGIMSNIIGRTSNGLPIRAPLSARGPIGTNSMSHTGHTGHINIGVSTQVPLSARGFTSKPPVSLNVAALNYDCCQMINKPLKQVSHEIQRALTLQRVMYKPMQGNQCVLKCQRNSVKFDVEISNVDQSSQNHQNQRPASAGVETNALKFMKTLGSATEYKEIIKKIVDTMM